MEMDTLDYSFHASVLLLHALEKTRIFESHPCVQNEVVMPSSHSCCLYFQEHVIVLVTYIVSDTEVSSMFSLIRIGKTLPTYTPM